MSGLKKHFNAETTTGRANVAKVTYASIALLYLFYRIKKKKTPKAPPVAAAAVGVAPAAADITPSHATPAPVPPPATHDSKSLQNHAQTHTANGTHTVITGGDQHHHQQQQQHPPPPPEKPRDPHEAEKQHAANVLAGAVSSHASGEATPSTNGGSCPHSDK